jgi:hypothetical protein
MPVNLVAPPPERARILTGRNVLARSEAQFSEYARRMLLAAIMSPPELGDNYPFRAELLRFSPELFAFLAVFDKKVLDGRSRDQFGHELWRRYATCAAGGEPEPEHDDGLAALLRRERRLESRLRPASQRFWGGLADRGRAIEPTWPPTGPPAGGVPTGSIMRHLTVSGPALARLRADCAAARISVFERLLAALSAAVFELSPSGHLILDIPFDSRRADDDGVMGRLIAALPVVVERPAPGRGTAAAVRAAMFTTLAHSQVSAATLDLFQGGHGARARTLAATYVRRTCGALAWPAAGLAIREGTYDPDVFFVAPGVLLRIAEFDEALEAEIALSPARFGEQSASDFTASLHDQLAAREGARSS